MALVQWTESVGLTLVGRDQSSMQLRTPGDQILNFTILQIFPFTYESKRMGIIVRVSHFYSWLKVVKNPRCAACGLTFFLTLFTVVSVTQTNQGISFPKQKGN